MPKVLTRHKRFLRWGCTPNALSHILIDSICRLTTDTLWSDH
jgi:hypothetical protein